MKNPFVSILCTLILSGSIIFCIVFAKKQQAKRFQLYFGASRNEFATVGRNETEKPFGNLQLEDETVPICIKIDTVTGKTWIYENDIKYDKDEDGINNVYHIIKFTEIPFVGKLDWVSHKK